MFDRVFDQETAQRLILRGILPFSTAAVCMSTNCGKIAIYAEFSADFRMKRKMFDIEMSEIKK